MPSLVLDLFTCWRTLGGRFQLDAVWKMIMSCLMWCLWRERNNWSFEDGIHRIEGFIYSSRLFFIGLLPLIFYFFLFFFLINNSNLIEKKQKVKPPRLILIFRVFMFFKIFFFFASS
jgi:hypothetical protein